MRYCTPCLEVQTVPDLTFSLSEFSGTTSESVEDWLNQVELISNQQRLAETQVLPLAVSRLRGAARNWNEAVGRKINEWNQWRNELMREFGRRLTLRCGIKGNNNTTKV